MQVRVLRMGLNKADFYDGNCQMYIRSEMEDEMEA